MTEALRRAERRQLFALLVTMMGIAGYVSSALGPALPLVRADLGISLSIAGLHFTALFAGGLLLGGVLDRITATVGRTQVYWTSAVVMCSGAALIGLGRVAVVTLSGALLAGLGRTGLLATTRAVLADSRGLPSDGSSVSRALIVNDVAWSTGALAPGILLGVLVQLGGVWRPVLLLPMATLLVVAAVVPQRRMPPSAAEDRTGIAGRRPPLGYWLVWAAFVPAASAEWSIVAWSAELLVTRHESPPETAAMLASVFFGAVLAGRLGGIRLAQHFAPERLLRAALLSGTAGAMVTAFWPGQVQGAVVGLGLAGLGMSIVSPLLVSAAIAWMPGRADIATARISIGASAAVMSAPIVLGLIADSRGIGVAYRLIPVMLLLSGTFVLVSQNLAARQRLSGPAQAGGTA